MTVCMTCTKKHLHLSHCGQHPPNRFTFEPSKPVRTNEDTSNAKETHRRSMTGLVSMTVGLSRFILVFADPSKYLYGHPKHVSKCKALVVMGLRMVAGCCRDLSVTCQDILHPSLPGARRGQAVPQVEPPRRAAG